MDPTFLARGLAIGFTVAAAVGPISLLTIRRTIAHGRVYGLASGLRRRPRRCVVRRRRRLRADRDHRRARRRPPGPRPRRRRVPRLARDPDDPAPSRRRARGRRPTTGPGLPGAFLSIYGLTMTNPMTILSFAGIFAGLGLAGRQRRSRRPC